MEKEALINKKVADLIVSLCFRINELKSLSVNEAGPNTLPFQWIYKDMKYRMDALLGALGIKGMVKEAGKTKDFVKNTLSIYKMLPNSFDEKTRIMALLDEILTEVTELEHLLSSRHLKKNL